MTATGCNKWKSLFSVGEEFDDEDLLDADWTAAAKSTSDRPASTSATVSSESSRAEQSTNVLGSESSLLVPKCSTTCHLSTLRTPTGSARDTSDVSITEKPPEVTFPPPEVSQGLSNQILSPSSEPLRVPQTPQPQDEFDDWDLDLEELDKSVSQVTSHISPAKRLRTSQFSGADPGVSENRFSVPQAPHSSTIQTPVCPSTPIHHLNSMRGTITPVSRFPSPVTPRPPFASPQCQLRTPSNLRPRGSLFHAVSSAPTPSPTARALNAPVLTNHLVQLVSAATKTPQRSGSGLTRSKTRRFPGPAGALPDQVTGQSLDDIVVTVPSTPAHGALARIRSEQVSSSQGSEEEEFSRGPWAIMKTEMGLDEKNPSCFLHSFSVLMVLRKAALKQLVKNKVPNMAVVLKNITHTHADAKAFFRDPTGEMQGTVHRRLVEDRQAELKAGAVLLLKQVGVFSPSHRNHYLNVTPNNLLRIYPADGVLQDSQLFRSPLDLPAPCEPTKPPGGPVSQMVLRFEEEDEVENEVGESRAVVGCNESCQEPSGSRAADDAAWDADDLDELLGELPL